MKRLFEPAQPVQVHQSNKIISKTTVEKEIRAIVPKINLKQEFKLFEATMKKTETLDMIYKALKMIKPTSTDAERTFSISGDFCTKKRTRLTDNSLNSLVMLKYYFLNT